MGVTTVIPYEAIPKDLLKNILEAFISREGTDYGLIELSMEEKVSQLKGALKRKDAYVVFDGETESTTIITAREAAPLLREEE